MTRAEALANYRARLAAEQLARRERAEGDGGKKGPIADGPPAPPDGEAPRGSSSPR